MRRLVSILVWVSSLFLMTAPADEALARRYQDVSVCRVLATDRALDSIVLSSEQPNELIICTAGEAQRKRFPSLVEITRVLKLHDGVLLIAGENAEGCSRLLLLEGEDAWRDVTPNPMAKWCLPIMETEREGQWSILAQCAEVPCADGSLFLLDIRGEEKRCTLFQRNEEKLSSWAWQADGTPMAGVRWGEDGSKHLYAVEKDGSLRELLSVPTKTRLSLPGRADEESVYVLHDQAGEGTCLARLNVRDAHMDILYADAPWDVGQLFTDGEGKLLGVNVLRAYDDYVPLADEPIITELKAALPKGAAFVPVSLSADRQRVLAEVDEPGHPIRIVLLTHGKGIKVLSPVHELPKIYSTRFAEYPAVDGTRIPVYYTLPEGKGPFPTVIFVHGGPRMRTDASYDWRVQYLVSQGFAVVQPQFRGSRGWGRNFMHAGNRQWGKGVMQTDVNDCIPWLVQQGIAESGRVAIFGGSYGGYAATAALCFYPGMYACGVSLFGPQNLLLYLKQMNAMESAFAGEDALTVGDRNDPADLKRLIDISPVFHAADFRDPLLIYYGEKDTLISPEHSLQLIVAMQRAGRDVSVVSLPDEAHGFVNPAHEPWLYACHIVPFLRKHLLRINANDEGNNH